MTIITQDAACCTLNIRTLDSIRQLKEYFCLDLDGKVLEADLDVVETECDLNGRKRCDAEVLCTLAANANSNCLDLGTSYGRSAFRLATNLGERGAVFTVNLLPGQHDPSSGHFITHLLSKDEIGSFYRAHGLTNIIQIYANTAAWSVPPEISELAVVYIDAAHDTDRVYEDTKNIYERVRPGGFICWHDFSPEKRTEYDWIDCVMRGVERFVAKTDPGVEIIHLRHSWIGIMRKPVAGSQLVKTRVGLVLDREFHEQNRWTTAVTSHLVNGILKRFNCCWIQNQADYENHLGDIDVLLSLEAGWGAPILSLTKTHALRDKLRSVVSYMFYSDPHGKKWREAYVLDAIDFLLAFYDAPTRYHFNRLPSERLVHFPWAIPDEWIGRAPLSHRGTNRLTVFGASSHEAYSTRNWCRGFSFVESCTNSGCENKAMTEKDYLRWMASKDAVIAAGSDDPRYRLTTPKYFEIAAMGSLLFAQETDDLEQLGFRHGDNCIVFNRSNFVALAEDYLCNSIPYLEMRHRCRELIRQRHSLSVRLGFLEWHIKQSIENRRCAVHPHNGSGPSPMVANRNSQVSLDRSSHRAISGMSEDNVDTEFENWFKKICVPEMLDQARSEPLSWKDRALAWEVCHEILACARFYAGRYSPEQLIELSNARYRLLDDIWPSEPLNREALDRFYQRSAMILPWGHGVFLADHNVAERRRNWLRRVDLLRQLQALNVGSLLDYGAGGGHTSLLAYAMGFSRVVHHEYAAFHPYVLWRAGFISSENGKVQRSEFIATDAAQPLPITTSVQAVLCTDVAEHVLSPDELLAEIRTVLLPGGYLVWVSMFGDAISCHLHGHLAGKEEALMARHGFRRLCDLSCTYQGYTGLFQSAVSAPALKSTLNLSADTITANQSENNYMYSSHPVCRMNAAEVESPAFTRPDELYLASADRMDRVLANLDVLRQEQPPSVDTYATVVGGLSGLNYLLTLTPLKIVFFDINQTAVAYARLVMELIRISAGPQDFIGRVFSRPIEKFLEETGEKDLETGNQARYLECEVNEVLLADTIDRLSPDSRNMYQQGILPHLRAGILDGVQNCRQLLPCWRPDERVPVGGGLAYGYNEAGHLVPNTNTFFYGNGWLESQTSFERVRQTIVRTPLSFQQFDLLSGDLSEIGLQGGAFVLHASNIDDWFPNEWTPLVAAWETQALQSQCRLTVITSHNGLHRLEADPHTWAYGAVAPHVFGSVVEVTHKVPWGFHEIHRINVTVPQYLHTAFAADTTILHILLGEGIEPSEFLAVYSRALRQSRRVVVLEHNRDSLDWGPRPAASFVPEAELRRMLAKNYGGPDPKMIHFQRLNGEKDGQRNLLFVMDTGLVRSSDSLIGAYVQAERGAVPTVAPRRRSRPRVMLMADVPNWIFARHCQMLERFLSDEFHFTTKMQGETYCEDDYDLIYPLEWNLIQAESIRTPAKYVTGIRSHVSWRELDFLSFVDFLATHFQVVHVVSMRLQRMFEPFLPEVVYVTHGVDVDFFKTTQPADLSGSGRVRIGWAGNRINRSKGFEQLIAPLERLPGVELFFCGYQDNHLSLKEMRRFYEEIDVYVCASSVNHEGNNNSILEAAAMQRSIITTDNGTVPEFLADGQSALIVEPELPSFMRAVLHLRDHPEQRVQLGQAARKAVEQHFDWEQMAPRYRTLFENALKYKLGFQPQKEASRIAVMPRLASDHQGLRRPRANEAARPMFSFCIITNGKRPDKLQKEIDSIRSLNIPDYEILIAGQLPLGMPVDGFSFHPMADAASCGRLGEMRNYLCSQARYDILVVADDDLVFLEDFYKGLCQFGKDFDVVNVRLLNPDGTRFWDWATLDGPQGHRLLDYGHEDPHVYVTGGLCIIKADVARSIRWNGDLGFYQNEDLDFSRRLQKAGYTLKFCPGATVMHNDLRYTQFEDHVLRLEETLADGVILEGFYHLEPDGRRWMSTLGSISLPASVFQDGNQISFNIMCSDHRYYDHFPFEVHISTPSQKIGSYRFHSSGQTHDVLLALSRSTMGSVLNLRSESGFVPKAVGLNDDKRRLSVVLSDFNWVRRE
jgi:glycosyltransferase involved in cell wall biosynthesis/SAM-dependent methyltransferase/predicted O-methyltransferase YrrM